ncbi:MAG TPA: hypothetical protein VFR34_13465 [Paracoccaceae bacterium]|nr:hypothetical protein [Paracoccaceae bacterium]
MSVIVRFNAEGASREDLHREAQLFSRLAASQPDLAIRQPEDRAPRPGEKGTGLELGTLILALVTSGAVTALINILQAHFGRNQKATLTFEAADGRKMMVAAENMAPDRLAETTRALKAVFETP